MTDLDHVLTIREAGDRLGQLLDQAADQAGHVPPELWREIAEAAVQIATAASLLAGGPEDRRVVDAVGNNLLANFPSVVDAVVCAVAVQKELASRNHELPDERRMLLRIGVNLGDVAVVKARR